MQQLQRRQRGEGSIYENPRSRYLWIKYYSGGKPVRESSRTSDLAKAAKILRQRIAQIERGESVGPQVDKIRIADLAEGLLRDYQVNNRKSLADVETRWRLHLQPLFGSIKAAELNSTLLIRYIDRRQQEYAGNATINRELACLKRMYRLASLANPPRVLKVPKFPHLQEDNVRQGFLTADQCADLVAHCDELWLRALVETAVTYGWRVGELLNLRVRQVDLARPTIRLEPGETKNREGREVVIASSTLLELLRQCVTGKDQDDHVFTRGDKPVRDFRKRWENLCTAAGVPGLLFHDLRRTAARNLRAAGVPEEIIMRIAGWKTAGVFRRYAIVSQADVRDALHKLETTRKEQSGRRI
jgi:integrase